MTPTSARDYDRDTNILDQRREASSHVDAGWAALARAEWRAAHDRFSAAAADSHDPRVFDGLAWAAWWTGDDETLFSARERAFTLYRDAGDAVAAARTAIWLGCDHHDFRGEAAVANGLYRRARRLLNGVPTCPEHGWLAFQEGAYALELYDDTTTAAAKAADVAAVAAELEHGDLTFLGLALAGLALVTEGRVVEGMHRLDEVGIAATTGEFTDRIATSWSLCYLIYACERVRDFDRARQWCARMQEVSTRFVFELGMGVCRAHYGGVLVFHGKWAEAEGELAAAGHSLARSRPLAISEQAVRLAELRRRQGRTAEAEQLFADSMPHPLAVVGLAEIAISTGDAHRAIELVDAQLDATPAASRSQRADALSLLARARAALGDAEGADAATRELQSIADTIATRPLQAMAHAVAGITAAARHDHPLALRQFEAAVDLYVRSGLPYEAECTRVELADVLAHLGRATDARSTAQVAERRLRTLGAGIAAQRAARAASTPAEAGSSPFDADSPLARLSARQIEVIALLADGCTDRQIAERLHISTHTAHRHISNIFTKLGVSGRSAAAAVAARHGLGEMGSAASRRDPISS